MLKGGPPFPSPPSLMPILISIIYLPPVPEDHGDKSHGSVPGSFNHVYPEGRLPAGRKIETDKGSVVLGLLSGEITLESVVAVVIAVIVLNRIRKSEIT